MTAETAYLKYALCNGTVIPTDELKVSPLSSGFMAGEGLFETIRVLNSRPVFFALHHARLFEALRSAGENQDLLLEPLNARCVQAIAANSLVNGSLKLVVFKDTTGWTELILTRCATYAPAHYENGFRLKTFPCDLRIDPLNGLKSLNYLRNLRAKRVALVAGFDEALFVDPNQHVLEGATTNIFIVQDGVISTPPLKSGILPGVMRAVVLRELAPQAVQERAISLDELCHADEVFVTNALLGIMPVAAVDEKIYNLNQISITRSLVVTLAAVR